MHKFSVFLVAFLGLLASPFAAADTIPAETMFGKALLGSMQISPDGKHLVLTYEEGTEVKLAVMGRDSKRPPTPRPGQAQAERCLTSWPR